MSSKKQGDFLKELQAKATPHTQPKFNWKKPACGGKIAAPEALGFKTKTKKAPKTESMVQETSEFKTAIRKNK